MKVWVNSGIDKPSYFLDINESDLSMEIPDSLISEMNYKIGDKLEFNFDEIEGILYISVMNLDWEVPNWLE